MPNTAIKERGILMHARSVNGILAGRKTQTRRIVKPQPGSYSEPELVHARKHGSAYIDSYCSERKTPENPRGMSRDWCWWTPDDRQGPMIAKCPYGQPGDRLWVRETWAPIPEGKPSGYFTDPAWKDRVAWYRADNNKPTWGGHWKPSIHMPRWASRITLEITDIRVERVQDISEADALAEGCVDGGCLNCGESSFPDPCGCASPEPSYRDTFISLWDDTNGEGAWDRNDWCWVVEFRRVEV